MSITATAAPEESYKSMTRHELYEKGTEIAEKLGITRPELESYVFPSLAEEQQDKLLFKACSRHPCFRYLMEFIFVYDMNYDDFCYTITETVKKYEKNLLVKCGRLEMTLVEMKADEAKRRRENITITSCKRPK